MTEGLGRSPRSRRNSGEGASRRFRRLAASDEELSLGDTQPSQPVKTNKIPMEGTQSSRPMKGGQVAPDEAPTVFPSADRGEWTPSPPPLGNTPPGTPPPTDESGMPLPRRVAEVDPDATQVTGAAYSPARRARKPKPAAPGGGGIGAWFNRLRERFGRMGCLPRLLIYGSFALIFLLVAGVAFALYE